MNVNIVVCKAEARMHIDTICYATRMTAVLVTVQTTLGAYNASHRQPTISVQKHWARFQTRY